MIICVCTYESKGPCLHMYSCLLTCLFLIHHQISVCACVYVCLRALELLREINQSANRRSSFSELAMISLLNSNLSVKYSLTGHLAFTDIVSDGFYDAGQVRAPLQFTCLHKSLQGM